MFKKSTLKKLFLCTIIMIFAVSVISCSKKDDKIQDKEKIVVEYILTPKNEIIKINENEFLDIEFLEKKLGIYAAADVQENVLSIVKDDKIIKFELANGFILNEKKEVAAYIEEESKFLVNAKSFMTYFKSTVMNEDEYKKYMENTDASADDVNSLKTNPIKYKKYDYVLAWDLYANKSNAVYNEVVDVIIPKWLSLQDDTGTFNDLFRSDYARNVKSQGKELWVLATNSFNPELSSKVLNSYAAREKMSNYLSDYANKYSVDGINIDFENMYVEDSDVFVQFIAELGVKLRRNSKTLSVCVTVPGGSDNWSKVYDRPRIAENVDFLTVMAYDQYWASSQVAGPVAAYNWVSEHIDNMTEGKNTKDNKKIPAEKIILGVPFYTRVWYESFSTEKPNLIKVRSRSVYMDTPRNMIKERGDDYIKVWDEESKSNFYVFYDKDKTETVKFWYDDEEAIYQKSKIADIKGLSGVACWAIGFENPNVWKYIEKAIK